MRIGYTEEQEALRAELRDYYQRLLTPHEEDLARSNGVGPTVRKIVRQMGEDGWLGIGWPEEYGGQGRSAIEQFVFFDESMRAGAPVPMLTINTVGPTIMNFGTDEQKDFFLPRILRGEIFFAIGYTEPGAGTDLASLQTRAVRDGDEYVINGQKIFTSLAGDADYVWVATRTNPEVKKHKGISMFIVPTDTPGFKVEPMRLMSEHDINTTYYEDVRVPAANLVGGENNGWALITNQLNHERVTLCSPGIIERVLTDVRRWAQQTELADGRRVIDQEWVQVSLARVHAKLEFLRLINWKVAWTATEGKLDVADASTTKVFGTEFYLEAFRLLGEVIGQPTYLRRGSPEAVLKGKIEQLYRSLLILTFGGGVNEVQRDLIAMFGLGLPRVALGGDVDFGLNEEQEAVRDLARRILGDRTTPERLKQLEAGEDPFDRSTWSELGEAGLLGIGLPEDVGGGGLGLLEVCLVLEEVGRHVAPLPVLPSIVMGALPVAAFGSDEQRSSLVPAAASGETILTAALVEPGTPPETPTTTATRDGDGWRLHGVKLCVPAGMAADLVLVPAAADDGIGVFLVDPTGPGVVRERLDTTSGLPEARLELDGATVAADRVLAEPGQGETVVDWVVQRATVGLCATMVGVCEKALELTAEHTKTREQFDRPLATFQAVAQRAADAYIDTEAVRLTTWQAAWRLAENLSASDEVAVAKFWAAEGGQRVVHAAQHLHGGLGVDRDYPLHRYFLWAKQLELTLGGATASLLRLGRALAAEPV